MPTYASIAGHAMLTAKAVALSPSLLAQHQLLAESLLGLSPPAYTAAEDVELAQLAIALQINFQLAQGLDPLFMKRVFDSHTRQSIEYLDRWVSPQAAGIVTGLQSKYGTERLADRWATYTSDRLRDEDRV